MNRDDGPPLARLMPDDPTTIVTVAQRVLDSVDTLLPRMERAYRREIPEYEHLVEEEMAGDVLPVSRRFIEEFFSRILEGGEPDPTEQGDLAAAARRRLEMGVSLDSVLHAFRVAGREVWTAVVETTQPGEEHLLATLSAQWIDYVDRTSSAFAEGYLSASHEHLRRLDVRRRAVLDAVLSAADTAELAAVSSRWSLTLARAYTPIVVEGEHAVARIDRLLAAAPPHTIAGMRGQRLVALLPAPFADVAALAARTELPLVAHGHAEAPGPVLASEVAHTEALLDVALASGSASGVVGPDDLLLEQLVATNPRVADAVRARVSSVLDDRDPDGVLAGTLRAYLSCGSVPETARREFVHVNTVAYRLKRVRELTGLDPRVPAEAAHLVLALIEQGDRS